MPIFGELENRLKSLNEFPGTMLQFIVGDLLEKPGRRPAFPPSLRETYAPVFADRRVLSAPRPRLLATPAASTLIYAAFPDATADVGKCP